VKESAPPLFRAETGAAASSKIDELIGRAQALEARSKLGALPARAERRMTASKTEDLSIDTDQLGTKSKRGVG